MTLAINTSNTSHEIWASLENDKRVIELTIINCQISESTIQKIQSIAPQHLTFVNAHITKTLLEPLIELRLKDLTCIDCTLKDADAEVLAFSGAQEKVVFKRCILTHLPLSKSSDKETISLGIMKTAEEVAVFNPDLTDLAEKLSEISGELLQKIDASERHLSIEQVDYCSLVGKQIDLARNLISIARTFIEESTKQLGALIEVNFIAAFDELDNLTYPLFSSAEFVECILNHFNRSELEKAKEGTTVSDNDWIDQIEVLRCANRDLESDIAKCKDRCITFFTRTIG